MPGGVIEATQLTRRFGAVAALRDVSLCVEPGEGLAILGPNGAGKTTLLRTLSTLLRPTSGALRLFSQRATGSGAALRRRIGMLSHQSFLYPDLTPVENLEFYARMFGVGNAAARIRDLLDAVGLAGWAHRPVRTLSRGLEQRCAVARALVHAPDLLLLDEPFSGLDVDAAHTVSTLLAQARAAGATLVLTTHDLARGIDLCTRAAIMVRGRVVRDAALPADARSSFVQTYLDTVHSAAAPA